MRKLNLHATVILVSGVIALSLAAQTPAAAKEKKLTYEQAWAKCLGYINKAVPGDQATARATWATACMKKYGHKI
jgi:hypothetical protein